MTSGLQGTTAQTTWLQVQVISCTFRHSFKPGNTTLQGPLAFAFQPTLVKNVERKILQTVQAEEPDQHDDLELMIATEERKIRSLCPCGPDIQPERRPRETTADRRDREVETTADRKLTVSFVRFEHRKALANRVSSGGREGPAGGVFRGRGPSDLLSTLPRAAGRNVPGSL